MYTIALLSTLAALASAQSVPASASSAQVQTVQEQYDSSGFDTSIDSSQSFGIQLAGQGLLTVSYGGQVVVNGQDYPTTAVAAMPDIFITPTSDNTANFATTDEFTLMLADASAIGGPDPEGDYRHYLGNSLVFGAAASSSNVTQILNAASGTTITYYAGPGPLAGSGTHRYAWLLFQQPASFAAPANLSTAGTAPSHWDVASYVSGSGLSTLVGASFFTVTATGTATFTPGTTSAVATSSAASSSSSGSSSSSKGSGSSSSSAAPTSSSSSGASAVQVGRGLAIALGLAGLALL